MRYNDEESYEQWIERVRQYEYGRSLQRVANGEPIEQVLEEMSRRIVDKSLYPILKTIRNVPTNYDAEKSRKAYEETYLNKHKPVADHVVDD
jgi:glutamyl-tRNA reductase